MVDSGAEDLEYRSAPETLKVRLRIHHATATIPQATSSPAKNEMPSRGWTILGPGGWPSIRVKALSRVGMGISRNACPGFAVEDNPRRVHTGPSGQSCREEQGQVRTSREQAWLSPSFGILEMEPGS